LAERLGIGEAYTEGRDERAWVEWILDRYRQTRFPGLSTLDEFEASNIGVYANPVTQPAIALADFRADPEAHPLDTPSGKIEIFSKRLHDMGKPEEIPAVPKYIQEWDSPFGPEAEQTPLQAIGHHTLHRVHSTHGFATTTTGWKKRSRTECSSTRSMRKHAASPMETRSRFITSVGRRFWPAA